MLASDNNMYLANIISLNSKGSNIVPEKKACSHSTMGFAFPWKLKYRYALKTITICYPTHLRSLNSRQWHKSSSSQYILIKLLKDHQYLFSTLASACVCNFRRTTAIPSVYLSVTLENSVSNSAKHHFSILDQKYGLLRYS